MNDQETALDQALTRSLRPPAVPDSFRARWRAALSALKSAGAPSREQLEQERSEQLALLRREYIRLRRSTFAVCLGIAFVGGAAAFVAVPLMTRLFGGLGLYFVPGVLAVIGVTLAVVTWVRRDGLAM
jgi:hypothetical protein